MHGGVTKGRIRNEMFHNRVKVISQNDFVLLYSAPSLKGDKWNQNMQQNTSHSLSVPPDPHTVGSSIQAWTFLLPPTCH